MLALILFFLILLLISPIIIYLLLRLVFKSVLWRILFSFLASFIVMIIISGIIAFIVFSEVNHFKEDFVDQPKVFLLKDNLQFLAGMPLESMEIKDNKDLHLLSNEDIQSFNDKFNGENYIDITPSDKVLIIIDFSIFNGMFEEVEKEDSDEEIKDLLLKFQKSLLEQDFTKLYTIADELEKKFDERGMDESKKTAQNIKVAIEMADLEAIIKYSMELNQRFSNEFDPLSDLSREEIIALLKSDQPEKVLLKDFGEGFNLGNEINSDMIKMGILAKLVERKIAKDGPFSIIKHFKEGDIVISPKFEILTLVNILPESLIKENMNKFGLELENEDSMRD